MQISSDNVKAALLIAAGIFGGYIVYKVYRTGKSVQETFSNTVNEIGTAGRNVVNSVGEIGSQISTGIKEAVGFSDYVKPAEYNVVEIPFSKWTPHQKATVDMLLQVRGLKPGKYAGDYVGWHVYSDGTIISPDKYYFTDQGAGENTTVKEIYSPTGNMDYDTTKFQWQAADVPSADSLQQQIDQVFSMG
jgi:hypothetical protein